MPQIILGDLARERDGRVWAKRFLEFTDRSEEEIAGWFHAAIVVGHQWGANLDPEEEAKKHLL